MLCQDGILPLVTRGVPLALHLKDVYNTSCPQRLHVHFALQGGQPMERLLSDTLADTTLPEAALAELERLNEAAAPLHIWLRTQANQPLQRPWHEAAGEPVPALAPPGAASPR